MHLRLTVPRRMVLRKERYAEERKELLLYCYIPAWMKNGGLIPWSAAVVCGMSKTSWKMEAHRIKGDLENHLSPGYSVGPMVEYHPVSAEDPIWQESFTWNVLLGYALIAGKFWKGDIVVADIQELDNLNASEIHPRGVREPTLRRRQPARSEDLREELQGNSERSQPTGTKEDAEAQNDLWSIEGDFICRHHIEPRVQLNVPKEVTFPIPLKNIDVTRSN